MSNTSTKIDAASPWALFETDKEIEKNGIKLDYGPFYFRAARAGGANTRFRDELRRRLAPHKRAMATETMSEDLQDKIALEVFCETVLLGWGSEAHGEGKISGRDGKPIEFSADAAKQMFKDLPDLARDVMEQAQKNANFRAAVADLDAGN